MSLNPKSKAILLDHDALGLAKLVKRGDITPLELVEETIEAIESLNPLLNAVVTPTFDEARTAATAPLPDGPLSGTPFLLKDATAFCSGVPVTGGSILFAHRIPNYDSELVRRYRKAGLIIVGKTNTPEFGALPTTEPTLFGACHNPWNPDHTTGGSSGGSAAAVAAGIVPTAHGTDGGGSIRIPASCCGVFGLKPTRARTPLGPDFSELAGGLVIQHVITRSVRDSAAVLDATAGPSVGDAYCAPPQKRPYMEEIKIKPKSLRIGFSTKPPLGGAVHPECRTAVKEAAKLLSDLGHKVEERDILTDPDFLRSLFTIVWSVGISSAITFYEKETGHSPSEELLEPFTWALFRLAQDTKATDYEFARMQLNHIAGTIGQFFETMDVWLSPTLAEPPVPLGTFQPRTDDPLYPLNRSYEFSPFTALFNVTGQPAASVPLYWTEQGLPIGIHIAGRFGDEATLFQLSAQLEQARPWIKKRPPHYFRPSTI